MNVIKTLFLLSTLCISGCSAPIADGNRCGGFLAAYSEGRQWTLAELEDRSWVVHTFSEARDALFDAREPNNAYWKLECQSRRYLLLTFRPAVPPFPVTYAELDARARNEEILWRIALTYDDSGRLEKMMEGFEMDQPFYESRKTEKDRWQFRRLPDGEWRAEKY